MSEPDAELLAMFRDEANGRLDEMDAALVGVESGEAGAESVDALFRNAHTIKGSAGMLGLDDVRTLAHAMEDLMAAVRAAGTFPDELAAPLLRATTALRSLVGGAPEPIGEVLDELAASQQTLARPAGPAEPEPERAKAAPRGKAGSPAEPATGEGAQAPGPAPPAAPEAPPSAARPSAPPPGQGAPAPPAAARPSPAQPRSAQSPVRGPGRRAAGQGTLRVPAGKIDHLLDVVGEVMQDRRRLAHSLGEDHGLPRSVADALGVGDRMLAELKDTAVGMRTIPLSAITGPLPRAVRDLARAAGKEVDFAVAGADTELDRVILESFSEPLTHLLRNSIDHGIEAPQEREQAGKPRRGVIELRAIPRGNLVEVTVADDGRGVSAEVLAEARRQESLTELLTQPGFSTAETVTELAGRGVGLDAVKSYVASLSGGLEIRSEPGRGMEVVLLLPLALALLEVLLFERGEGVFGLPLPAVEEVVAMGEPLLLEGRRALEIHGRSLPVADLADLLGTRGPPLADRSPALVISAAGRRAVVACDRLLGQEEVVVKPLGPIFDDVRGYLGTAILGDGRIALLVEPGHLTRRPGEPAAGPRAAVTAPAPPVARKVLVVEDSFTVRELQRSILEAAGYPVVTARDGKDALAALDREGDIAMVVTDLEMPELDGLGLTRAIRSDPARSSLPVVVVTSHGSQDDRRQGIEAGADAYMVKSSFDQQALLTTVEQLIGR